MHELTLHPTESIDQLAWPEDHQEFNKDSSALSVFTDFEHFKPLVIESDVSIEHAEQLMKKAHVRLKLVVDANMQFVGVISLDDLHQQQVLKKLAEGHQRKDLNVADFMHKKSELMAFDFKELMHASVSDVVRTLKENCQHHCLVIDHHNHKIRGIISAGDIARKLKVSIDIQKDASFINIYKELHLD